MTSPETPAGGVGSHLKLIDVSHVIEDGMVTYKGLPAPSICDYLGRDASRAHYGRDTSFHIGRIEMVANTGTYVDAPFHRYADGVDIAGLPLASIANLPGVIVRIPDGVRAIDADRFRDRDVRGKAVIVHTGWDRHWRTERYFEGHPFLTGEAAEYLRDGGTALVGIDSVNIDDIADPARPVHTTLLGAGIPIVEHLCRLDALPDSGFAFYAAPARVKGLGSFPVRAFGLIPACP